jgi:hypothetical protein
MPRTTLSSHRSSSAASGWRWQSPWPSAAATAWPGRPSAAPVASPASPPSGWNRNTSAAGTLFSRRLAPVAAR